MAEETNDSLDLDLDGLDETDQQQIENRNKLVERIRKLSDKVGKSAGENAELVKLNAELRTTTDTLTKERDFYASFTDASAKYPGASEFKDTILEKVKSGYTVEDATVAVLAKEGKLGLSQKEPEPENPAGGSAVNRLETGGEKEFDKMSREEKREVIKELGQKGEINFS